MGGAAHIRAQNDMPAPLPTFPPWCSGNCRPRCDAGQSAAVIQPDPLPEDLMTRSSLVMLASTSTGVRERTRLMR